MVLGFSDGRVEKRRTKEEESEGEKFVFFIFVHLAESMNRHFPKKEIQFYSVNQKKNEQVQVTSIFIWLSLSLNCLILVSP